MREQMEYLVYVDRIVLRHQILALLSVTNNLTELKDSMNTSEKAHINSTI